MLQNKKLFPESRLRESFHVSRLSNRLCRLCHTVFSLLSHGRWVHSGENNESGVSWHTAGWTGTDVPGLLAAEDGESEAVTVSLPTCLSAGP